jgi:hypothetical protein
MGRPSPYGVQWDEYECNEETKQRAKKRRTEFFAQEAARETLQGAGRHEARGTVSFYLFLPEVKRSVILADMHTFNWK